MKRLVLRNDDYYNLKLDMEYTLKMLYAIHKGKVKIEGYSKKTDAISFGTNGLIFKIPVDIEKDELIKFLDKIELKSITKWVKNNTQKLHSYAITGKYCFLPIITNTNIEIDDIKIKDAFYSIGFLFEGTIFRNKPYYSIWYKKTEINVEYVRMHLKDHKWSEDFVINLSEIKSLVTSLSRIILKDRKEIKKLKEENEKISRELKDEKWENNHLKEKIENLKEKIKNTNLEIVNARNELRAKIKPFIKNTYFKNLFPRCGMIKSYKELKNVVLKMFDNFC